MLARHLVDYHRAILDAVVGADGPVEQGSEHVGWSTCPICASRLTVLFHPHEARAYSAAARKALSSSVRSGRSSPSANVAGRSSAHAPPPTASSPASRHLTAATASTVPRPTSTNPTPLSPGYASTG